jgi:hypothetical protein
MGEGNEKEVWSSGVLKVDLDTLRHWLFCIASAQEGRHKRKYSLGHMRLEMGV